MENCYLFVYGTLRQGSGHPMSVWLAEHAHYLGQGRMEHGQLYQVSFYPALVQGLHWIRGDLYSIPPDLWPTLDQFEGVEANPPEYERRLTLIQQDDGTWLTAWVYWYLPPVSHLEPVGGDWLARWR